MRNELIGGCFCNNITFVIGLTQPSSHYNPRECDCDFCQKHGAAALSDKDGTLNLKIKDLQKVNMFRQGSKAAEFLICKECGVFVAVCFDDNGKMYGAINSRTVKKTSEFATMENVVVSKCSY